MSKQNVVEDFKKQNESQGLRVFVAGGSRPGNDEIYVKEAYNLGRQIIKMDFRLDFGLSNQGIMGAVARGVLEGWSKKQGEEGYPIQGITTKEYYNLYPSDDALISQIGDIVLADTLEERKRKLLESDFVVFAPGGVGTLDELSYDLVAMQDGFLEPKPFIMYNVNGFFYHLLEYLKDISLKDFADPVPFIVVDNSDELEIVFRLLKIRSDNPDATKTVYGNTRQLIYELPYFFKKKVDNTVFVEDIVAGIKETNLNGTTEQRQALANEIEQAYLEKEIDRMQERLARVAKNAGLVGEKLEKLKIRQKEQKGY